MAKGCKALIVFFLLKEKKATKKKKRAVHLQRGDFFRFVFFQTFSFCVRNLGEDGEIELDLRITF